MLHITNGDCAAEVLRETKLQGEILTWDDVLHDGPVPAGLSLEQLSRVRARHIADCGWGPFEQVLARFAARDARLIQAADAEEIVLWFEHDLYDQLQLVQLLAWFAARPAAPRALQLVCVDEYLGQVTPDRMLALHSRRHPVGSQELQLGARAWQAFCASDPRPLEALLREDLSALPYLEGALLRLLQQYPSALGGLSRTERQALAVLAAEPEAERDRGWIFAQSQQPEERVFLGDSSFFLVLDALASGPEPLLTEGPRHRITQAGLAVLAGRLDWPRLGGIDRWLGGVHLQGRTPAWRWNEARRQLVGPA